MTIACIPGVVIVCVGWFQDLVVKIIWCLINGDVSEKCEETDNKLYDIQKDLKQMP